MTGSGFYQEGSCFQCGWLGFLNYTAPKKREPAPGERGPRDGYTQETVETTSYETISKGPNTQLDVLVAWFDQTAKLHVMGWKTSKKGEPLFKVECVTLLNHIEPPYTIRERRRFGQLVHAAVSEAMPDYKVPRFEHGKIDYDSEKVV